MNETVKRERGTDRGFTLPDPFALSGKARHERKTCTHSALWLSSTRLKWAHNPVLSAQRSVAGARGTSALWIRGERFICRVRVHTHNHTLRNPLTPPLAIKSSVQVASLSASLSKLAVQTWAAVQRITKVTVWTVSQLWVTQYSLVISAWRENKFEGAVM